MLEYKMHNFKAEERNSKKYNNGTLTAVTSCCLTSYGRKSKGLKFAFISIQYTYRLICDDSFEALFLAVCDCFTLFVLRLYSIFSVCFRCLFMLDLYGINCTLTLSLKIILVHFKRNLQNTLQLL